MVGSVVQGFFPLSVSSLVSVSVLVSKVLPSVRLVLPSVRSVLPSVSLFGIKELRVFLAHNVVHWFGFEIKEVVCLQSRGEHRSVS